MVKSFLIAGIGGSLGSGFRFLISRYIQISYASVFPRGTFMVNINLLEGMIGFGASSVISSCKFRKVTERIPTLVQIVDEDKKIMDFFETIRPMLE